MILAAPINSREVGGLSSIVEIHKISSLVGVELFAIPFVFNSCFEVFFQWVTLPSLTENFEDFDVLAKVLPDDLEFEEGDQMWSSNKRTKREIRNLLQKTDPKKLWKILFFFWYFFQTKDVVVTMFKKIRDGMNQSFKKKLSRLSSIKWTFARKVEFCSVNLVSKFKTQRKTKTKHKTKMKWNEMRWDVMWCDEMMEHNNNNTTRWMN